MSSPVQGAENISVCVRVRPLLESELVAGWKDVVRVVDNQIILGGQRKFAFDTVFTQQAQSDATVPIVLPLIDASLQGFNSTVFAYGQTGAGKTFSMMHLMDFACKTIVESSACTTSTAAKGAKGCSSAFSVSMMEIYNEQVIDLLDFESQKTLVIREDVDGGAIVPNLMMQEVTDMAQIRQAVEYTSANRKTGSTLMNQSSSRSHAIFTLYIKQPHLGLQSKFHFVDLAGSERLKKSYGNAASNEQLRECVSINSGLLALGNVITALCEKKVHVPFRSSKLTRILQNSLAGNSKTAMVACISCADVNFEESLNTLKYANRAKSIATKPIINATTHDAAAAAESIAVAQLRAELAQALSLLRDRGISITPTKVVNAADTPATREYQAAVQFLEEQLRKEKRVAAQLEEDLFKAEYSAMVENAERKRLEQDVQQLLLKEQEANSSSSSLANSSRTKAAAGGAGGAAVYLTYLPTPTGGAVVQQSGAVVQQLDQGSTGAVVQQLQQQQRRERMRADAEAEAKLRQLEMEREELAAEKALIEEQVREFEAAQQHCSPQKQQQQQQQQQQLHFDPASATVRNENIAREIEAKESAIANLTEQHESAQRRLAEYEGRLENIVAEKRRLAEELTAAEWKLEQTEMEKAKKETQRQRLKSSYEARLKAAEVEVVEYRQKRREIEAVIRQHQQDKEKIKRATAELANLREQQTKLKADAKFNALKADKLRVSHTNEVSNLNKKLKDSEVRSQRLFLLLERKEQEIRTERQKLSNQTMSSTVQKLSHRTESAANAAAAAASLSLVAGPVALMKEEMVALTRVEKDIREASAEQEKLVSLIAQAKRGSDAMRLKRGLQGWENRRADLHQELQRASTAADLERLQQEIALADQRISDLQTKLPELCTKFCGELSQVEDRIDSLNAAKDFHIRRIKQYQDVARQQNAASSSSNINTAAAGALLPAGSPSPARAPSTASASAETNSNNNSNVRLYAELQDKIVTQRMTIDELNTKLEEQQTLISKLLRARSKSYEPGSAVSTPL